MSNVRKKIEEKKLKYQCLALSETKVWVISESGREQIGAKALTEVYTLQHRAVTNRQFQAGAAATGKARIVESGATDSVDGTRGR